MISDLETDLKHVSEWSAAAARHHLAGAHREALMHARMVGEAACRVIIRVAWPGRRGEEGAREPSYDLLLRLIQNKALAPPEVVSALHVLRTRGNNATHGGSVSTNDSAGALFMLHALLKHLFTVLLQRPVPTSTASAINEAISGQQRPERHTMLREILREEERAQKDRTPTVPLADPADVRRIEAEQESHRARIRDMEELVKQMAAREAATPVTPVEEVSRAEVAHGKSHRAPIIAMIAIVALALGGWFALHHTTAVQHASNIPPPDSTVTTVLILPFAVMQDDPNLNIRFEQAIETRIRTRASSDHLPMRVLTADTVIREAPSRDSALAVMHRYHADVVFYGELYEPTASDSGRILIRFAGKYDRHWPNGDLRSRSFRTLADSAAIRTQLAAQAVAEHALAEHLYEKGAFSQELALLFGTPMITDEGIATNYLFRARCHENLKDLAAAIHDVEQALRVQPDNTMTNNFMGDLLAKNGDLTAAIGFYEKAITIDPKCVECLMDLASVVCDHAHPEHFDEQRTRDLVHRAIAADSTCAPAWLLQGEIFEGDARFPESIAAFEHALDLDTGFVRAKDDLANVLAMYQKPPDPERAERLLREVLRADSSNSHACLLLAQILNNVLHKEPELAERLFRKSREKAHQWEYASLTGCGNVAYEAHRYADALDLFQQAWRLDSSDLSVGVKIASQYEALGNYRADRDMLLRCYALDSMYHAVNACLGSSYLDSTSYPVDRKRAIFHLERAMATDPFDVHVLSTLGIVLMDLNETERAKDIFERLHKVDPTNHTANGYLGIILAQRGRLNEATPYLERAIQDDPTDPMLCGNLASIYADQIPPRSAEARVLLDRALAQWPNEVALHITMCQVLLDLGDPTQALSHYRQAVSIQPRVRNSSLEKRLKRAGAL